MEKFFFWVKEVIVIKLLIPTLLLFFTACASSKAVAPESVPVEEPVPAEVEEPTVEAPQPPEDEEALEEQSAQISMEMPSIDWVRVSQEELDAGQVIAFRNAKLLAHIDIFMRYQEGTDAHKIAQYLALTIAMSGGEPLEIEGSPDGSWHR